MIRDLEGERDACRVELGVLVRTPNSAARHEQELVYETRIANLEASIEIEKRCIEVESKKASKLAAQFIAFGVDHQIDFEASRFHGLGDCPRVLDCVGEPGPAVEIVIDADDKSMAGAIDLVYFSLVFLHAL